MTGNWQFTATPATGGTAFTGLSGYIDQVSDGSGSNYATMDVLTQATGCYAGTQSVPLKGSVAAQTVTFRSFEINGDYLDIDGTLSSDGATFQGTYQTYGSCSNAKGSLAGVKYATIAGSYQGSFSSAGSQTLQLALTQNPNGTGQGTFLISGSATMAGMPCFTEGTLAADGSGFASGNTVSLAITTNDPGGAMLLLNGSFDAKATTLSFTSATIAGGSCPGSLPAMQIVKQS